MYKLVGKEYIPLTAEEEKAYSEAKEKARAEEVLNPPEHDPLEQMQSQVDENTLALAELLYGGDML